ncbi:MAG: hypothetical protein NC084_10385 [Bacteroides sp.]|nr:hypothetical protein [Eubacterium sp.]MCM1418957.1 hypothetical protein [Roseburia sp.]MCM1463107.1 hypothetical protein [Bacteroides sp.]
MAFYVVVTVVSAVVLTVDMILRYMEKIRSFGLEERLHRIRGKTIPIEDFIPQSLTMAAVFSLALGVVGIFLKLLALNGLIAFPVALMSGALVHFILVHFILRRIRERPIPPGVDLSECEAVCTERVDPDGYGSVRVKWGGREYVLPAVCANEKAVEAGDRAVILYREDGVCFIERDDRIMDILKEEDA